MSVTKRFIKGATQRAITALNRADEIGGEVRDYLQERIQQSEGAQRALARVQSLRPKKDTSGDVIAKRTVARDAHSTKKADPSAASSAKAADATIGLGDNGVAAQIYGRSSCPWTGRSIRLMEDRKLDFDYIDMDEEENARFEPELVAETKQNTHPWIYLRGTFIGGFNALSETDRLGQLPVLTMSAEERAKANPADLKVEIAARVERDEPETPPTE